MKSILWHVVLHLAPLEISSVRELFDIQKIKLSKKWKVWGNGRTLFVTEKADQIVNYIERLLNDPPRTDQATD